MSNDNHDHHDHHDARTMPATGPTPNRQLAGALTARPSRAVDGMPMSRHELADAVNTYLAHRGINAYLTAKDIGRYIRGETRWPRAHYRQALRAILGAATDADLGFYPHRRIPHTRQRGQGFGGAAAKSAPVSSPASASIDQQPDTDLVGGLLSVAKHYRHAYHALPTSKLLTASLSHLDVLQSVQSETRSQQNYTRLVAATCETAALVGVLFGLDSGSYRNAVFYLDIAWSAARAIEDIELQSVVLGCRSHTLAYGYGKHRDGLECADFARRISSAGASRQTRAWVAAVASERCASLGDLGGCRRRLEESRRGLDDVGDIDGVWRGIGGYNIEKSLAYEGGNLARLGHYKEAELILSKTLLRLGPDMKRHRATALLDRAGARIGIGEPEGACLDSIEALQLIRTTEHVGHVRRVETITRQVLSTGASSAHELEQQLAFTKIDLGFPPGKDQYDG